VAKEGNVYDLKKAISERTGVAPANQQLDGFAMPAHELTDDLPLLALDVMPMHPLLLRQFKPVIKNVTANLQTEKTHDLTLEDFTALWDTAAVDGDAFTAQFEEMYGPVHPTFRGGQYSELTKFLRTRHRLCVVLLDADLKLHQELLEFYSQTITSESLAQLLDTNFVTWVGQVDLEKELEFQQLFGEPLKFPFLAVIGYIDNTLTLLTTHQGQQIGPDELMGKLIELLDIYGPNLEKAKQRNAEADRKRMEVEEQNRAFEESLLADRRKEEERIAEEKKQQAQYTSGLTRVKQARELALTKLQTLPAEPAPGVKAATVQIRLPDGTKLQRKFPADALFQVVRDYTEGSVAQLLQDTTFLDDSTPDLHASDVRPWSIGNYEFVNNFPKKRFDDSALTQSLAALGLAPQGMLFLQEKNK
jgi:hypothetical protein